MTKSQVPKNAFRPKAAELDVMYDGFLGYWITAMGPDWDLCGPNRKTLSGAVKAWNKLMNSFSVLGQSSGK